MPKLANDPYGWEDDDYDEVDTGCMLHYDCICDDEPDDWWDEER